MDPVSDENRQENESDGEAAFSQNEIDALFDKSGEDAEATPSAADNPTPRSGGAGAEIPEPVANDTDSVEAMGGGGTISQSDIDALMNSAQGGPPAADDKAASQPAHAQMNSSGGSFAEAATDPQYTTAEQTAGGEPPPASTGFPADASPLELSDLSAGDLQVETKKVTMLNDVNLRVKLRLGKTKMLVEDILNLGEGSVVELDKLAGDPIDVLVNDRLIARGEVLVLNDSFCVRICEVLSHDPHRITT